MKILISDLLKDSIIVDKKTVILSSNEVVEVGKEVTEFRIISKVIDGDLSEICKELLSNIVRVDKDSDLKLRLVLYYENISEKIVKNIFPNIEKLKDSIYANSISVEFHSESTKIGRELLSKSIYS